MVISMRKENEREKEGAQKPLLMDIETPETLVSPNNESTHSNGHSSSSNGETKVNHKKNTDKIPTASKINEKRFQEIALETEMRIIDYNELSIGNFCSLQLLNEVNRKKNRSGRIQ